MVFERFFFYDVIKSSQFSITLLRTIWHIICLLKCSHAAHAIFVKRPLLLCDVGARAYSAHTCHEITTAFLFGAIVHSIDKCFGPIF